MVPKLVKFPDPRLRVPAKEVTDFADPALHACIATMLGHLKPLKAVGLAAQQLGYTYNVAVFRVEGLPEVMLNPRITAGHYDGDEVDEEGCVSLPGVRIQVSRPKTVMMEYFTPAGTPVTQMFTGYPARVVQHECDHLSGILITDKGSPFRRAV